MNIPDGLPADSPIADEFMKMHEIYLSAQAGGFTKREALEIVIRIILKPEEQK